VTNGSLLEMKTTLMPQWFKRGLWDKFKAKQIGSPSKT